MIKKYEAFANESISNSNVVFNIKKIVSDNDGEFLFDDYAVGVSSDGANYGLQIVGVEEESENNPASCGVVAVLEVYGLPVNKDIHVPLDFFSEELLEDVLSAMNDKLSDN